MVIYKPGGKDVRAKVQLNRCDYALLENILKMPGMSPCKFFEAACCLIVDRHVAEVARANNAGTGASVAESPRGTLSDPAENDLPDGVGRCAVSGGELQIRDLACMELPEHFTAAEKKMLDDVRHLSADKCDEIARGLTNDAGDIMKYAAWLRERQRTLVRTACLGRN